MLGFTHRRKIKLSLVVALMMTTSLLTGCSGSGQANQFMPTGTTFIENTPQPTHTIQPPTPIPPTATPSPAPGIEVAELTKSTNEGLFILAMNDGDYDHLYAYHPVNFPLTRLTNGDYDYADPAVSPNGEIIAYCANPDGRWEIFTLNLLTGLQVQVSHAGGYACAPTWSSDGLWLAYETPSNGKLVILLQSTLDIAQLPLNLTDNTSNSFDPAWSPGGREIAFVTDRNGRLEVWTANLDAVENRLAPLLTSTEANYSSPAWSLDGQSLAWNKVTDQQIIEKQSY